MARKKQTFMLVNLNEKKSKDLAQAISNDSCRKILDYLAEKEDATESKISAELKLPISTVHYNLNALQKGGLVDVEEFHYSEKGKEVNHYKLANKYIIIAPKSTYGIKEKLRGILPVVAILGAVSLAMQFFKNTATFATNGAQKLAMPVAERAMEADMMEEAVAGAPMFAEKAVEEMAEAAPVAADMMVESVAEPNIALWFFVGALSALALFVLYAYIRQKIKKD